MVLQQVAAASGDGQEIPTGYAQGYACTGPEGHVYAAIAIGAQQMRDIYLDESSTAGQKWMVLGALIVPTEHVLDFVAAIRAVAEKHKTHGEMKWGKISRAKLPMYLDVVDAVFDAIDAEVVQYHSIIINTYLVNHSRFNDGSREVGYNKWAYQLLSKAAERNASAGPFYVYMDDRSNALGLSKLQRCLNDAFHRDQWPGGRPFHRVVFRDSKTTRVLQACDLLTGAVAFKRNGCDKLAEASPHKIAVAKRVGERAKLLDLSHDTSFSRNSFRMWTLRLRK